MSSFFCVIFVMVSSCLYIDLLLAYTEDLRHAGVSGKQCPRLHCGNFRELQKLVHQFIAQPYFKAFLWKK